MKDLSYKEKTRLVSDYMLFVQHNTARWVQIGRAPAEYGLKDYLVEELNYTLKEAEDITKEVKQFVKDRLWQK